MKRNKKMWLALVSLLFTGCSAKIYEYNTFSKIRKQEMQIYLAPTLSESSSKVIYGNPYSFCFSYNNSRKVLVDIDLHLIDVERGLVRSFKKSNLENKPNIFSLLIDEEISLKYRDHIIRGSYTVKDINGSGLEVQINEKLFFKHRKNRSEILY